MWLRDRVACRVSLISVDLPEPETPVMQVSRATGRFTVYASSGCCRCAPVILSTCGLACPSGLMALAWAPRSCFLPEPGNRPVRLFGVLQNLCEACPRATTLPAVHPGAGADIDHVVGGCGSRPHRVRPRSRCCRYRAGAAGFSSRRSLSRWCRPMEGSSSTYITPVRPEPICEARRMRCASPPERVSAERSQRSGSSRPTSFRKVMRLADFACTMLVGDLRALGAFQLAACWKKPMPSLAATCAADRRRSRAPARPHPPSHCVLLRRRRRAFAARCRPCC